MDGLAGPAQRKVTITMPFKKLFVPMAAIVCFVWALPAFDKTGNGLEGAFADADLR
jgi:hypothetical protein